VTVLSEIRAFLLTQGFVSASLFIGTMPDLPDACAALYEYGGAPPTKGFGVPGLKYEMPGVQIVTRGAAWDYTGPRDQIEIAFKKLPTIQAMTLSGTKYLMLRPQHSPYLLERDAKNRVKFTCSFLAEKELSA
jgi:hypothetical protein